MKDYFDFSFMLYFGSEGRIVLETFWSLFVVTVVRHLLSTFFSAWPVLFSDKHSIPLLRAKGKQYAQGGVSIILASHNTDREILQSILSLREQTIEKMQIILINDGSTDFTHNFARDLMRKKLIDNYIHLQTRGGKAAGLNAGLQLAKYEYTMFCDTGTTYHRDAIEIALGYFENPNVAAVSCGVGARNSEQNLLTYLQKLHYFISCTVSRHALNFMGLNFVISGAFGLFRTSILRALGGHAPGTGEDLDLTLRLKNLGWDVEFSYFSTALTDVPETIKALVKQTFRWDRDGIRLTYQIFAPYTTNPFLAKFNPKIAIGYLDNFIVGFVLPILMYIYMAYFLLIHAEGFLFFLFTVLCLTMVLEVVQVLIGLLFVNSFDRDWRFLYYAPLYVLFKQFFYEPIRFAAIWSELVFKHSKKDNFAPKKVRDALKRGGE